mgnify:CR=1 FL=1
MVNHIRELTYRNLFQSVVEFISDLYFVFIFVGAKYEGKKFKKGVTCGVSIMRSGKSSFEMWQLAAHSLREHNYHYVHYSSLSLILPCYGKKLTFGGTRLSDSSCNSIGFV